MRLSAFASVLPACPAVAAGQARPDASGTEVVVTALAYSATWRATTDQPLRAIESGAIGRFGSLDPSDGGRSARYSLSANYAATAGGWMLRANAYAVRQRLTLWNDFTPFLADPVDGDRQAQNDRRILGGGGASPSRVVDIGGVENRITLGLQARYDDARVDLIHTRRCGDPAVIRDDRSREASVGGHGEDQVRWASWLRTVLGLRGDVADRAVVGDVTGTQHAALTQPKGSVILGPWTRTEFYFSAGRGFRSNAPSFVGAAGLLVDNLGRWFGAVPFRDLGAHPLVDDGSVRSAGYRETNADIGYRFSPRWRARIDMFNLTDSHDDAADCFHVTRLPGDPAECVPGLQIHPLEPRSLRFTLAAAL